MNAGRTMISLEFERFAATDMPPSIESEAATAWADTGRTKRPA